jgi:hypothetical protein
MRASMVKVLIASGAVALCGGATLAAGAGEGNAPAPAQGPVTAVEPDQAASFGVLRRPRAQSDRMPDDIAARMEADGAEGHGAAPGLARRALVTRTLAAVYVVPARGWLCVFTVNAVPAPEAGGGCNRTGEALRGYLVGASSPAPGVTRIVGLVPDGVTDVVLRAKDGTVERVTPQGNAYAFETVHLPRSVEWGDAVIPVHSPLEM